MVDAARHERTAHQLRMLSESLDSGRLGPVRRLVNSLSAAEIGNLLESLPPAKRVVVWGLVDPEADGEVLTIIRPAKGLLGGMRALPSCDWRDGNAAPPFPAPWRDLGAVTHGFTHFELSLAVRGVRLPAKPALAGDWLSVALLGSAGLPTLFEKAAVLARARMDEVA